MVALYLMTEKGYQVLLSVINEKKHIKYVVSCKDEGVLDDFYDQIQNLCKQQSIPFFHKKDAPIAKNICKIAIGWRWIIADANNLIVLHDSLLPKYRGFAPLVNALINGDKKIGVTALFANEDYDTGEIIKSESIEINYPIKIADAIKKISICYANLVNEIIDNITNGRKIKSTSQNDSNASYSIWRDELDYYIDWTKSAQTILNTINALGFPYTGAKTILMSRIIIIQGALIAPTVNIENRNCNIGKIIFLKNSNPVVICGEGLLQICDACFEDTGESIFPLKQFRLRFGNCNVTANFAR